MLEILVSLSILVSLAGVTMPLIGKAVMESRNEQAVIDDFTAGGFVLLERSDMLANPDDDHTMSGFEPEFEFGGRHAADRYLLKFQKPEASDS